MDAQDIVERYVAQWNEPDPDTRAAAIRAIWAPDAVHLLEPPQEVRDAAHALAIRPPALEVRGHDELALRVARAYEEFVAPGNYVFRARDNAARLGDIVKFNWEMVPTAGGDIAALGLDVFVLDEDNRIRIDHQFIESLP